LSLIFRTLYHGEYPLCVTNDNDRDGWIFMRGDNPYHYGDGLRRNFPPDGELVQSEARVETLVDLFQQRRRHLANAFKQSQSRRIGDLWKKIEDFSYRDKENGWVGQMLSADIQAEGLVKYRSKIDAGRCSSAKISKVLQRLVRHGCELTEDDIQVIATWWARQFGDEKWLCIIRPDIKDAYRYSPHTCMTGHRALEMYCANPDKVQVVSIYENAAGEWSKDNPPEPDRMAYGRCLLWQTDQGDKVLDRIYPADNGPHFAGVAKWAKRNGIWYRKGTRPSPRNGYINPNGEDVGAQECEFTVTVKHAVPAIYPYMDTFAFVYEIRPDQFTLANRNKDRKAVARLQSPEGGAQTPIAERDWLGQ